MSARKVIAWTMKSLGAFDPTREADAVLVALHAAGYRILGPGELDTETVEQCAELIETGYDKPVGKPWRKDGKPSKNDECPHGRYMYEDCEPCAVIAIRSLAGSKDKEGRRE